MRHGTGLDTFIDIVAGGILCYSGAPALSAPSLCALPLVPLEALDADDRVVRWTDWRSRPGRRKELKAGWVCPMGVLVWIVTV